MKSRILIVEDEASIAMGLKDDLELEGYEIEVVSDGNDAVAAIGSRSYDLMLLDVMLPGKSGYDVCREVRTQNPQLPIIMLTAKSHEAEKVLGLEMGADDYVTKPFSPLELRARVKAVLRRSQASKRASYALGPLEVDFDRMEVRSGGARVDLTALEFKLLVALIQHEGRVLSRNRLLDIVWGSDIVVSDRVVDTHVANLRKKLGSEGSAHISSIRGVGEDVRPYRL